MTDYINLNLTPVNNNPKMPNGKELLMIASFTALLVTAIYFSINPLTTI